MAVKAGRICGYVSSVEYINNHFVSNNGVAGNKTLNFYLNNTNGNTDGLFLLSTISEFSVVQVIESVKSNACGHDLINIQMLKLCGPYTVPFLTHTISECLVQSYFSVL